MKNWIFVLVSVVALSTGFFAKAEHYHQDNFHQSKVAVTIVDEYGYRLPLYNVLDSSAVKKSYIQALPGQRYSIEVRNNTHERVGFVIAVDGRNIITGKPSYLKSKEKMYILDPYQVSTFRGWRSSANTVNRFYFTDSGASYAGAFSDYSAMGVIAVAAFYEKYRHQPPHVIGNKNAKQRQQHNPQARQEAGTGWGESEHSPTSKTTFNPQRHPFTKQLIKYAWHQTLCEKEIIPCYRHRGSDSRTNRLWDDEYAPPPPPKVHRHYQR